MALLLELTKNQVIDLVCTGRPGGPKHPPIKLFSPSDQSTLVQKGEIVHLGCRACFVDPNGRSSYRGYLYQATEVATVVETREIEDRDDNNPSTEEQTEDMGATARTASSESHHHGVDTDEPTPTCIPFRGDKRKREDVGSPTDGEETTVLKPKRRKPV